MHRRNRLAVLLSIAVLAGFMLSVAGAPSAEAGGNKIKTKFAMVENPAFVPFSGASGRGHFKLNIEDKEFDIGVKAKGLLPNHSYQVFVTLTLGSGGGFNGTVFLNQGDVMTDKKGRLNFKTENSPLDLAALMPAGADGLGLEGWRVDQAIIDPLVYDDTKGCNAATNPCSLVCAPTTRITPADLGLSP